jgi:hypothetical protein
MARRLIRGTRTDLRFDSRSGSLQVQGRPGVLLTNAEAPKRFQPLRHNTYIDRR